MAKRAEIKIYDNINEDLSWELENEFVYEQMWSLEHGEIPQQQAAIYRSKELADFEIVDNKTLSYNEVLTLNELANISSEFYDVCAVVIVKHAAPCGVALAPTVEEAYNKAFDCDPMASFFGSIGFTQMVTEEVAKHISSMSMKLIMAPDFDSNALNILRENKNLRIVKLNTPLKDIRKFAQKDIHVTPFGTLSQNANKTNLSKKSFNVVTKVKPTQEQIEDAVFAWKLSKYSRSNSVIIAKDFKTSAIAQGFISPIPAVEFALNTSCDNSKDAILVSDTYLPTTDCIHAAAQGRIAVIVQPGGAQNESAIIELADKYNIAMVMTGIKNYKH